MGARGALSLLLLGCGTQPSADACAARLDERLTWAAVTSEPAGAPERVRLPSSADGVPRRGTAPLLVVSLDEWCPSMR